MLTREELEAKRQPCEIYARPCGYLARTSQFNEGKAEEFKDRKLFKVKEVK
jgi:anaerobic ribonucleoside-triphosphate reductase